MFVDALQGSKASYNRCARLQEVQLFRNVSDELGVDGNVLCVEATFRVGVVSCPNVVTHIETSGPCPLLDDDSSAVHAWYQRKLRSSPGIPGTIAYRCIPHAHARGMKSDENFSWSDFWNSNLVQRKHRRWAETVQRCGFHGRRNCCGRLVSRGGTFYCRASHMSETPCWGECESFCRRNKHSDESVCSVDVR